MGFAVVDLDALEGEGPGGMVRKVRRALDARAFGFNYFTIPAGVEGREHDHAEQLELRPGRFVRVDGASVRVPVAGPDGLEFVTFGAPLDGRYEPPSWG